MTDSTGRLVAEINDFAGELSRRTDRVQIMEICGTHTVSLFRTGVKSLLPETLRLVSGPGCPVCVTPQGYLDAACELAGRDEVILATYGDMVRVPGQTMSLAEMRSAGAEIAVVYSARDALELARKNPDRKVVFLAVGFETTTPATAATVLQADRTGVENFFLLEGHKRVIPAMEALLSAGDIPIDGFLCPGHVSVILGAAAYEPIVARHGKICVIAGFEATAMLTAIVDILRLLVAGHAEVINAYPTVVSDAGNAQALAMIEQVFEPGPSRWRAIGEIPDSGLLLQEEFRRFDARRAFEVDFGPDVELDGCLCGQVIQGKVLPKDCPHFGTECTPIHPVGPCMVSSEGACSAWFKYGR